MESYWLSLSSLKTLRTWRLPHCLGFKQVSFHSAIMPVSLPHWLEDYGLSIQFQRHKAPAQTSPLQMSILRFTSLEWERFVSFSNKIKEHGLLPSPLLQKPNRSLRYHSLQDRILKCLGASALREIVQLPPDIFLMEYLFRIISGGKTCYLW